MANPSILSSVPRAGLRVVIILFCLFHMTAVAAYSINEEWKIAPLTFTRKQTLPWVRSYMLITSQWQQWNLFSPDPLRRVSRYRVQTFEGNAWQETPWLHEGISRFHRAGVTKTLRRLEEQGPDSPRTQQFLLIACREQGLAAGTLVRVQRMYHVLPKPERPLTVQKWKTYLPDWKSDTLAERSCP